MAKKLADECGKALKGLVARLEAAEKFVVDQAPDICKEILTEKSLDNVMGIVGSLLAVIIFTGIIVFCQSQINIDPTRQHDGAWVVSVLSCVAGLACLGKAYECLNYLLTVKKCPKLVVLRELRKMIGN